MIVKSVFCILIASQHFGSAERKNACSKLVLYPFSDFTSNCFYNPDESAKTPELIIRHGYPLEVHKVQTGDGYILTLYRIPSKMVNGTPAYLHHGILASSKQWVISGNRSLAFRLHDLGYDVWLNNNRGTEYSKGHMYLKSTENAFWDFSLDALARYDSRDSIKYIFEIVKTPIIYIGHSMGSTVMFMFSAEYPNETQQLIRGLIALCPVVYAGPNVFEKLYSMETYVHTINYTGNRELAHHWESRAVYGNAFKVHKNSSKTIVIYLNGLKEKMWDISR